jgi:hypothetical protein
MKTSCYPRHRHLPALLAGMLLIAAPLAVTTTNADDASGRWEVAMFADERAGEQIVVVSGRHGRQSGIEGTDQDARLLRGKDIEEALRTIRRRSREDGVSMVSIDGEGDGGVEIVADDEDGDSAYIRIGEGGITIHAGEGEDSFHMTLGDTEGLDTDDAVRVHARSAGDDADRAVIMLRGMDDDATRDFIRDLDDVPRSLKREMEDRLGL